MHVGNPSFNTLIIIKVQVNIILYNCSANWNSITKFWQAFHCFMGNERTPCKNVWSEKLFRQLRPCTATTYRNVEHQTQFCLNTDGSLFQHLTQRCQVLRFVRNYFAYAANITVLRATFKKFKFLILKFFFFFWIFFYLN